MVVDKRKTDTESQGAVPEPEPCNETFREWLVRTMRLAGGWWFLGAAKDLGTGLGASAALVAALFVPGIPALVKGAAAFILGSMLLGPLGHGVAAAARHLGTAPLGRRGMNSKRPGPPRRLRFTAAVVLIGAASASIATYVLAEQDTQDRIEAEQRQRVEDILRERERTQAEIRRANKEQRRRERVQVTLSSERRRLSRLRTAGVLSVALTEAEAWTPLLVGRFGRCRQTTELLRAIERDVGNMRVAMRYVSRPGSGGRLRAEMRQWVRWSKKTRQRIASGASSFTVVRFTRA